MTVASRGSLLLTLLVAACGGSATIGDVDDTLVGTDTDTIDDTTPVEDTDGGVDDPGLPAFPCHAWDPLDVSGAARTYSVTTSEGTADEVHALALAPSLPRLPPGTFGIHVTSDADPATDVLSMSACDAVADEVGAYEIAFDGLVVGVDLDGVADTPYRYLPGPGSLDRGARPTWESATTWRIDANVSVPTCPEPLTLRRTTTGSFTVVDYEDLVVPGLGTVRTARLDVVQTERVDGRGSLADTCTRALEQLNVIGAATVTRTRTHRWYGRGIGLVAGLVVAPDDAACADPTGAVVPEGCEPALDKRLTACSGLPGCP